MQTQTNAGRSAVIHARIEPRLKKSAEKIFHEVGISMSDAINIFLRQVTLHDGLPFEVRIPNKKTRKALDDSTKRRNLKRFNSVKDMLDSVK